MPSNIGHLVKSRESPKDIFITPEKVARLQLKIVNEIWKKVTNAQACCWLDNSCNTGVYYRNFPASFQYPDGTVYPNTHLKMDIIHDEISQDFLSPESWTVDMKEKMANKDLIICSNPPYSILNKWLQQTVQLKPVIFSYLLAAHALTPARMEKMEKAGYVIADLTICCIRGWFGMSFLLTWIQKDRNIQRTNLNPLVNYDRGIYKKEDAFDLLTCEPPLPL